VGDNLDVAYGHQEVLDQGFHQAIYPAMYNNPATALSMMPPAQIYTQPHVEQAANTQWLLNFKKAGIPGPLPVERYGLDTSISHQSGIR
jgi:hypothetical protein